jgi:hypothetical protein
MGKSGAEFAKFFSRLSGFFDFARTDARGADFDALACTRNKGADRLEIWVPAAAPSIVGVADDVAEARSLAAVFTLHCHDCSCWLRAAAANPESFLNKLKLQTYKYSKGAEVEEIEETKDVKEIGTRIGRTWIPRQAPAIFENVWQVKDLRRDFALIPPSPAGDGGWRSLPEPRYSDGVRKRRADAKKSYQGMAGKFKQKSEALGKRQRLSKISGLSMGAMQSFRPGRVL